MYSLTNFIVPIIFVQTDALELLFFRISHTSPGQVFQGVRILVRASISFVFIKM